MVKNKKIEKKPIIALIGAAGRVSTRVSHFLLPNYQLIFLQHKTSLSSEFKRKTISNFDVKNKALVTVIFKELKKLRVRTVINFAGNLQVDALEKTRGDKKSEMYQVNVIGAENCALGCLENNLRLIHISTEYVFDGKKTLGEKYTEIEKPNTDLKTAPTWYGLTKALGEEKVLNVLPESVILRLSQVQSPIAGLFFTTLHLLSQKKRFCRASNQYISPVIDETAAKSLSIIEKAIHEQGFTGIIHVSAINADSVYNLTLKLAKLYGFSSRAREFILPKTLEEIVKSGEQKIVRPYNSILEISKFQKLFGRKILDSVDGELKRFFSLYPKDIFEKD